jgi:ribonuclease P protein component
MAAADAMAALSPAAGAGASRVETLKRRADFLAAARARRWAAQSFTLQGRARTPAESERTAADLVRIGYTCSKKVGNAVARNRAKRRWACRGGTTC